MAILDVENPAGDTRSTAEDRLNEALVSLKEIAKSEIHEVFDSARTHLHHFAKSGEMEVKNALDSIFSAVGEKFDEVKSHMDLAEAVRRNPAKTLTFAAGTGLIVGFAFGRGPGPFPSVTGQNSLRSTAQREGRSISINSPWFRLALDLGLLYLQDKLGRRSYGANDSRLAQN